MPLDATQLTARLRLDFRAGDVGDSDTDFAARIQSAVNDALSRRSATPTVTDTQLEYGARWVLLSAQVREVLRSNDSTKIDDVEVRRDATCRIAELRRELQSLRLTSGLDGVSVITRAKTLVARVQAEF